MAMGSSRSEVPLRIHELNKIAFGPHTKRYARSCDPSYLGREALDMVLLAFQNLCRNEHREVRILYSQLFDLLIEPIYRKPSDQTQMNQKVIKSHLE